MSTEPEIGGGNRESRKRFLDANPGLEEHIAAMVAEWPPMPAEAVELWRAARRHYLASLAAPTPKTK